MALSSATLGNKPPTMTLSNLAFMALFCSNLKAPQVTAALSIQEVPSENLLCLMELGPP